MADAHSHLDGLSSLINFTGVSMPARARFIAKFIGSTLISSLTVGLVAGQTGALLSCGPLIPFMTGSWIGYTWGCIGFWKRSKKNAITCARRYPKILAHGLLTGFDLEVPTNVNMNDCQKEEINKKDDTEGNQRQRISMEEWVTCGGVGRLSYAILAAQSCEEDIVEMQKNERQKLVNQYSSERK